MATVSSLRCIAANPYLGVTMQPIPDAELRLEFHPTNPPQPMGFAVIQEGRVTAILTREQLVKALVAWNLMEASRAIKPLKGDSE